MTLTLREKLLAAIHGEIDPDLAEAIEQCLAAGWIVQDGERPDGNGVMRPAYRIADGVDRSKLPATLSTSERTTRARTSSTDEHDFAWMWSKPREEAKS